MGELARRSGAVSQPSIGRYINGTDRPKQETFEQLCAAFPPRVQEDLTAAYLAEQIPPIVGKRVVVSIVREGEEFPVRVDLEQPLPGSHNEWVIKTLTKYIMIDPNLAIVLDYLASAKEGRDPVSDNPGGRLQVMNVEERAKLLADAERDVEAAEAEAQAARQSGKRVRYTGKKDAGGKD